MSDDFTHTGLEVVGRHVPDANSGPFATIQDAMAAGYDVLNTVSGTYEIGVVIDGAFVPIISEKASLVFDRIDLAKANAPAAPEPVPASPPAEPASSETQPTPQTDAPAE